MATGLRRFSYHCGDTNLRQRIAWREVGRISRLRCFCALVFRAPCRNCQGCPDDLTRNFRITGSFPDRVRYAPRTTAGDYTRAYLEEPRRHRDRLLEALNVLSTSTSAPAPRHDAELLADRRPSISVIEFAMDPGPGGVSLRWPEDHDRTVPVRQGLHGVARLQDDRKTGAVCPTAGARQPTLMAPNRTHGRPFTAEPRPRT